MDSLKQKEPLLISVLERKENGKRRGSLLYKQYDGTWSTPQTECDSKSVGINITAFE